VRQPEHRQHLGQRTALARQHDARAHDWHAQVWSLRGQRSKLGLRGPDDIGQEAGALRAGGLAGSCTKAWRCAILTGS